MRPHVNKGSRFWEPHWGMTISSVPIWSRSCRNMQFSWSGSLQFQMFNQRVLCSCIVQMREQTVVSGLCVLMSVRISQCLSDILGVSPDQCYRLSRDSSSLPLSMGGLGLRSAVRTSVPAFWASWADSLQMVHEKHPVVAEWIVEALEGGGNTPTQRAVVGKAWSLDGVEGFEPPSWRALSRGARPPVHDAVEMELGSAARLAT